ncbi:MAG TPA: CvpA family protein [Terriglobia bacterium]|nr:CvpA family protein [Terriglobia bacterium]
MGEWNGVDWVLAAILIFSIITAIQKGFVRELISLASVVAALVVAALGYPRAAGWFADLTSSREVALAAGFLTLFLGTLALGLLVSAIAAKLIRTVGLGWFDRFLGGIFGLVRGIVVDSVLLMIAVAFAIKPALVGRSQLAPYITTGARAVALAMPSDLRAQFREGFEKFKQGLSQGEKITTGH